LTNCALDTNPTNHLTNFTYSFMLYTLFLSLSIALTSGLKEMLRKQFLPVLLLTLFHSFSHATGTLMLKVVLKQKKTFSSCLLCFVSLSSSSRLKPLQLATLVYKEICWKQQKTMRIFFFIIVFNFPLLVVFIESKNILT